MPMCLRLCFQGVEFRSNCPSYCSSLNSKMIMKNHWNLPLLVCLCQSWSLDLFKALNLVTLNSVTQHLLLKHYQTWKSTSLQNLKIKVLTFSLQRLLGNCFLNKTTGSMVSRPPKLRLMAAISWRWEGLCLDCAENAYTIFTKLKQIDHIKV